MGRVLSAGTADRAQVRARETKARNVRLLVPSRPSVRSDLNRFLSLGQSDLRSGVTAESRRQDYARGVRMGPSPPHARAKSTKSSCYPEGAMLGTIPRAVLEENLVPLCARRGGSKASEDTAPSGVDNAAGGRSERIPEPAGCPLWN